MGKEVSVRKALVNIVIKYIFILGLITFICYYGSEIYTLFTDPVYICEYAYEGRIDKVRIILAVNPGLVNATHRRPCVCKYCEDQNPNLTPLQYALWGGKKSIVELLISKGADIRTCKYKDGWTLLMEAASNCPDKNIIELLISKGIDINAKDRNGETALSLAVKYKISNDIVDLLRKHGAREQ